MKKNVTIQEIANLAGVSKTTISRYLNGKYGNMSLKTKAKIKQIIEEQDYRPSKQAQGLKTRKSWLIGLLVADIENLFSAYLIKAAQDALEDTEYQLIIMNTNNSVEEEHKAIQKLIDQNVEGLLLQPIAHASHNYEQILEAGIPTVLVDRVLDEPVWTTVQSDNLTCSKNLAQAIVQHGYQKIVVVTEPINELSPRVERLEGVRLGTLRSDCEIEVLELKERGHGADVIQYLEKHPLTKRTAFFASNGNALSETVAAIIKEDLSFPEDIGVCGFDDWFWAELIKPGITTIHQNPYVIGQRAAGILMEEMTHPLPAEKIEIPAEIIVRHSL
ncbi:MAG: LacI family DNA-binding transcriptional regulator [Enterococcaceae bacterium]|nr:LacI family DNA-binding transcriptional regulator [Enterococcaceae bacterium]